MHLNLRRQLWTSLSIIVGSIIAVTIGLNILSGDITILAGKISSDRSLIDQQTGILAILASLKAQEPQAAVYQSAMDGLLPTQDGLIDFTSWIADAAKADGVSAQVAFQGAVTPGTGVTPGNAGFSFTVTGPLNAISAFLSDIETKKTGFIIQINSYDLSDQNEGYQLTGQGSTFFRSL